MATKAIQVELLLGGVMDDGDVALAGGKVFTYAAGTLTNKTTWTDRDKTTPATNPIILDAAGKATIFADGVYKFVIKDADDVTIRTIDNLEFSFASAFTGTVSFSKGADIASANALTLGTDGNYFDITGTTAILSIAAVGIGTVIKLHFDGVLALTHHATNLILPGVANITTAAGDEAEFIEYSEGNWICTKYSRSSGLPVKETIDVPPGTKMVFYQAAAPTGWTESAIQANSGLRVVAAGGTGGTSGGTTDFQALAHVHEIARDNWGEQNCSAMPSTGGALVTTRGGTALDNGECESVAVPDTGSTIIIPKFMDVIVCTRD